ncbi:MAG: hypothetical protein ACI83D_000028 [Planctomycetota bacterium]|jgi:hypothetical protein
MFGIEWVELIQFFKQLGLALSGAASLWGMFFVYQGKRKGQSAASSILHEWMSRKLILPLFGGMVLAIGSWFVLQFGIAEAHEGIRILPTLAHTKEVTSLLAPLVAVWLLFGGVSLFSHKFKLDMCGRNIGWLHLVNFIFVSVIMSIVAISDVSTKEVLFFWFHGYHSIFTLGTVLILDYLFLSTKSSVIAQQHLFPFFPLISKVIWVGLALDLFSVFLILPDALILEPRFFFSQTVVGILIINGVLLSGVITRRILGSLSEGGKALTQRWVTFADIAGTISVTSWLSITFVDFFSNLTLTYVQLLGIYTGIVLILYAGHALWEHADKKDPEFARYVHIDGSVKYLS